MQADINTSIQQLRSLENYEEASNALLLLARQRPDLAQEFALEILKLGRGDGYLRAFAFNMLYGLDKVAAFSFIRQMADSSDSLLFSAMLTEVADDVGLFGESKELQGIVSLLLGVLEKRNEEMENAKAVKDFLGVYGSMMK